MILHLLGCRIVGNHGFPYYVNLLLLLRFVQSAAAQSWDRPNEDGSLTVVLVVLISTMAFLGSLALYLWLRGDYYDRDGRSIQLQIMASGRPKRANGLNLAVVENFPTFIFSSVVKAANLLECPVCLSEFEDDDTLRLLPKCNHVFHRECIDAWLAAHSTCPVCRCDLIPESDQVAIAVVEIPDLHGELDEVSRRSNMGNEQNQVSVRVNEDQSKE